MSPTPALYNYETVNHLGTWNVRGINGAAKREEVLDVFKRKKVRVACLDGDEIKRKRRGIMMWNKLLLVSRRWKELGKGWPSC